MARIRIISDGTPKGSRLLVDGAEVPNVVSVEWRCRAGRNDTATAVVELLHVEIDAEADEIGGA